MWTLFDRKKTVMPTREEALPGRPSAMPVPEAHFVSGHRIVPPFPEGMAILDVGMGCFWGAERKMWQLAGVYATAVGYAAGHTPNPTYEEVCTGRTGHNEVVRVVYDPEAIRVEAILRTFWESHDPTQGYRQGNDTGTQYRSAIYYTTDEQRDLIERTAAAYAGVIAQRGYGDITTQVAPAEGLPFYYAEGYHQQYLYKVPNGYRCHANTGLALPAL